MRFASCLLAASLGLLAVSARAEDPVPSLDLRGFHPPTDPAGLLYLEPSVTPGPGNWNVGAYVSYALAPVVLDDAQGDELARVVEHQLSVDYFGSIGIGSRLAFGAMLPTVAYQTGDEPPAALPGAAALPHTTLGDLAVTAKGTLLSPSDLGGLGVALLGRLHLPTGNPRSYVSDAGVRGELRALGELGLLALSVRATAGYRLRGTEQTFVRDGTDDARFGSDIPWGAAITLRPQAFGIDREGRFRWSIEARGAIATVPEFASGPGSPALIGASARYTVAEVSALLGVEVPLNDAVGNPMVRPVLSVGWAPRFEDADNDGLDDETDECPELSEDRDGFEDRDGCPDFDDDDDGVGDADDKCPKQKEDADDWRDEDGCPDPDNDEDGVPDATDPCPNEKGPASGPRPGCVDPDPDRDGVAGASDRCPTAPEDQDGFADEDGCPDPDDDLDGVLDADDVCVREKGEPSPFAELNGCVIADHDGDTFDDGADSCPKEPEDFDGVEDEDGCPDAKAGKPLGAVVEKNGERSIEWRKPPRIAGDDVDPKTLASLRFVAQALNADPRLIAAVGARPEGRSAAAEQAALNRAFAVVLTLRWLTHRDGAAEAVGWGAVRDLPGAAPAGIGVLLLSPKPSGEEAPR